MNVSIVARHFNISDKTREYIQNEVDHRLGLVFDRIVDCKVVVEKTKKDYIAEVVVNVPGETITAKQTSDDLSKSVDLVVKKTVKQLSKHKNKWKRPIAPDKQFVTSSETE
jgi:putative sigma-54 modulation protein